MCCPTTQRLFNEYAYILSDAGSEMIRDLVNKVVKIAHEQIKKMCVFPS